MNKGKVVVAMSGGVDSSVAAAVLNQEGFQVIGLTMDLFSLPKDFCKDENLKSCCGMKAKEDAHRVARSLGIEHYVVRMTGLFERHVIDDFISEYVSGRTPNPCIRCNQFIKFEFLLEKSRKLGADFLATGHYARIKKDNESGMFHLLKGKDPSKDQSYFLYTMTQDQMSAVRFPVGEFTKEEVRQKAHFLNLPVAEREESQEICFIPDNDYVKFLKEKKPESFKPGPIINEVGAVLGKHQGVLHYTIGQRRGLGIAAEYPLYVLEIHPENNTIVVGKNAHLYKKSLNVYPACVASDIKKDSPIQVHARLRYRHKEAPAEISFIKNNNAHVIFHTPQRAITPGQSVVFYNGERVIGGGIIQESI